jgi:hypothetical protein
MVLRTTTSAPNGASRVGELGLESNGPIVEGCANVEEE